MLAQFALIAFALCATLSLIVDIGYARLTQAQMQNAADAAALEGLRYRDAAADPADSDLQRRTAASVAAARVFDDDLDPTNGDPDFNFGAGPIIDLTDGLTALHGSATMTVPDVHVYKPNLQLNQDNAVHGDMVSGRFCYTDDPFASEGQVHELIDTVCAAQQTAAGSYARNDFNPNLAGATDDSAFLVRLRRSNEFSDSLGLFEDSVASGERALPLTFGRGTLIFADDPSGSYSVRRDGLTVRATAIADARPALQVGLPQTNPVERGITAFGLFDTCAANGAGTPVTINVSINPATGIMTRTAGGAGVPGACPVGAVVGRFFANRRALSAVGVCVLGCTAPETALAAAAAPCPATTSVIGFTPIGSTMSSSGATRVIGFAGVTFTRAAVCPATPPGGVPPAYTATIVRAASTMPPANVSAILYGGLPLPSSVRSDEVRELLDKNQLRNSALNYGPLMAPALAR